MKLKSLKYLNFILTQTKTFSVFNSFLRLKLLQYLNGICNQIKIFKNYFLMNKKFKIF